MLNLLAPQLETILKITFKLLCASTSLTAAFTLPEIFTHLTSASVVLKINLTSFLCKVNLELFLEFLLQSDWNSTLQAFSASPSSAPQDFWPTSPNASPGLSASFWNLHLSNWHHYMSSRWFKSESFSPNVVFVDALQLFHPSLVFPLLLSDLKQPKQNRIFLPSVFSAYS